MNLIYPVMKNALREKCPNTEIFLVRIQPENRKIPTRKNSVFGHFSRSDGLPKLLRLMIELYF